MLEEECGDVLRGRLKYKFGQRARNNFRRCLAGLRRNAQQEVLWAIQAFGRSIECATSSDSLIVCNCSSRRRRRRLTRKEKESGRRMTQEEIIMVMHDSKNKGKYTDDRAQKNLGVHPRSFEPPKPIFPLLLRCRMLLKLFHHRSTKMKLKENWSTTAQKEQQHKVQQLLLQINPQRGAKDEHK